MKADNMGAEYREVVARRYCDCAPVRSMWVFAASSLFSGKSQLFQVEQRG